MEIKDNRERSRGGGGGKDKIDALGRLLYAKTCFSYSVLMVVCLVIFFSAVLFQIEFCLSSDSNVIAGWCLLYAPLIHRRLT